MRGVLVTGTDTGVGKTFVAALLCRSAPGVTYVKPAQTGMARDEADAAVVARLAGVATRGLRVRGIVVNGYPQDPDVAEQTNLEELAAIAAVLGVVPIVATGASLPPLDLLGGDPP